jgi:hypothetical protein
MSISGSDGNRDKKDTQSEVPECKLPHDYGSEQNCRDCVRYARAHPVTYSLSEQEKLNLWYAYYPGTRPDDDDGSFGV